jgi:hypothetical protein
MHSIFIIKCPIYFGAPLLINFTLLSFEGRCASKRNVNPICPAAFKGAFCTADFPIPSLHEWKNEICTAYKKIFKTEG